VVEVLHCLLLPMMQTAIVDGKTTDHQRQAKPLEITLVDVPTTSVI
jgi:hypothetical protein